MRARRHLRWTLAASLAVAGCGGDGSRQTPSSPTAVTATGQGATGSAEPTAGSGRGFLNLPPENISGPSVIVFPPRNEPFDFRVQLEAKYRDELRRNPVSSFVDQEGTIVWTQEYLRYRLNGCLHVEAIDRVFRQIDGFGVQPVCGAENPSFPPRDQPFDFRVQLEAKYRDGLRRAATSTFVDAEGDIVWTQEYLRYRVSGCGHSDSVSRVFLQIEGRGVQPDCRTSTSTFIDGVISGDPGSDLIYHPYTVGITGTREIILTWGNRAVDLDLGLTPASCTTLTSACLLAASVAGTGTTTERIQWHMRAGEAYHIWIENLAFTSQAYRLEVRVTSFGATPPTASDAVAPAVEGERTSEGMRIRSLSVPK